MTFEDTLAQPTDYRNNPFTQDIARAKDNRSFQQSPLLRAEHEDPSIHLIGETLPKPGDSEATYAGRLTSVGASPYPARADHSHDSFLDYTHVGYPSGGSKSCAAGQTILTHSLASGQNFYAPSSSSLLVLPSEGDWQIVGTISFSTQSGAPVSAQANLVVFYLNGTSSRRLHRRQGDGVLTDPTFGFVDNIVYGSSNIGVNATVEFAWQHNDVTNHNVVINVAITRLSFPV